MMSMDAMGFATSGSDDAPTVDTLYVMAAKRDFVVYAEDNGAGNPTGPINSHGSHPVENELLEFAIEDMSEFLLGLQDHLTVGTAQQKLTWANFLDSFAEQSPYTDLDQDGDRDLTDVAKYHWNKAIEDANPAHAALAAAFKRMAIEIDSIQGEVPLAGGPT